MSVKLDTNFLTFGTMLRASLEETRLAAKKASEVQTGPLAAASDVLVACLGSILSRPDREFPVENVAEKVRRAAIHVAVVQGIHIVEYCLSTGSYVQAGALIRQEMEAVEGLRGIRQGVQKDGSAPRIKALRHLGRAYTQVTELAHLSRHELLAQVTDIHQTGFDNTFNPDFARFLTGLHLTALVGVAIDIAELHPFSDQVMLASQEEDWLASVCGVLAEAGFMKVQELGQSPTE